jgi:hypothetical protein
MSIDGERLHKFQDRIIAAHRQLEAAKVAEMKSNGKKRRKGSYPNAALVTFVLAGVRCLRHPKNAKSAFHSKSRVPAAVQTGDDHGIAINPKP